MLVVTNTLYTWTKIATGKLLDVNYSPRDV